MNSIAIVMSKQTLQENAPEPAQQFKHNLSLAATTRSDSQRRDALAYLTSQLSSSPPFNPIGTQSILDKLLPLISNNSGAVRSQLLKLFRTLPETQVRYNVETALPYIRMGMLHLSRDVNNDSLSVMEWLLDVAGSEVVSSPGGWVKPINCFCASLGWADASNSNWSSAPHAGLLSTHTQLHAKQMTVFAKFLEAGFKPEVAVPRNPNAYWDSFTRMPIQPHPFAYIHNTFQRILGSERDQEGVAYSYRDERQKIFERRFLDNVTRRNERLKKEGGVLGRAAALLDRAVKEGMQDFNPSDVVDARDLLDLW
jgi:pre-rRNA-processing protein IPI1